MQADTLKKEVCFNCAGSKQGASDCCSNKKCTNCITPENFIYSIKYK